MKDDIELMISPEAKEWMRVSQMMKEKADAIETSLRCIPYFFDTKV